jgi:gentisate 1,2-dioxygenase
MAAEFANEQSRQLAALYDEMRPAHLFPLWEVLDSLVPREPDSRAIAAHWSYGSIRRHLMQAGELISAEQAERRVLILENPGLPGEYAITPRLYAGLQLVLPGEIAPCHRHSQSALRFVLEGEGAYTAVDGEKAYMRPFDLILTPNWRWHDHGNPSDRPVIWLDGLDIPMLRTMETQFAERLEQSRHPETAPAGCNRAIHGRGLRPLRTAAGGGDIPKVPLFHYPFEDWRASLAAMAAWEEPDPHLGHALEFQNPSTGGAVMATISAHVRLLPPGFETRMRRSTEGSIFTIVEGRGEVIIDGQSFTVEPRDVVVVPSWKPAQWKAAEELVLFTYSDRVVQETLGLYREYCE